MKGWVYIITNKAMPGIVKIGYSTKDPSMRAEELDHTGSPHPYIVEYEILIDDPYLVEQQIHKALAEYQEGKEWFRCSAEKAIAVIKNITENKNIHLETFLKADRQKAEEIRKTEKLEREKEERIKNEQKRQQEEAERLRIEKLNKERQLAEARQKQREEEYRRKEAPKNLLWRIYGTALGAFIIVLALVAGKGDEVWPLILLGGGFICTSNFLFR